MDFDLRFSCYKTLQNFFLCPSGQLRVRSTPQLNSDVEQPICFTYIGRAEYGANLKGNHRSLISI